MDPARAVVIHLAAPEHGGLIELLDASRSEASVLRDARTLGIGSADAHDLLTTLRDAGLAVSANSVLPDALTAPARSRLTVEASALAIVGRGSGAHPTGAEALRRRAATSVLVTGVPRLVVPVATALAAAGVGHVDARLRGRVGTADMLPGGLSPDDVGKPRATASATAIMRAAPDVDTRRLRDGAPSFLIQVGQDAPAELFAHGLARRKLPHLLIEERDDAILVGPLVIPGRSACIRCQDLHRRDRDPAWPAIAAQLATAPGQIGTAATSTALIAVGIAAGEVLGFIDGLDPDTAGASIEIRPVARIRRRSWEAHPSCACIETKHRSMSGQR